jgi:DNA-damage-inducible protein J
VNATHCKFLDPSYIVAQEENEFVMSHNAVVRARIDERLKNEASAVLSEIGLTMSDAFRLMVTRIAKEKRLPFEPLIPNASTIAAMEAAQQGDIVGPFHTVADLMADLNNEGD